MNGTRALLEDATFRRAWIERSFLLFRERFDPKAIFERAGLSSTSLNYSLAPTLERPG